MSIGSVITYRLLLVLIALLGLNGYPAFGDLPKKDRHVPGYLYFETARDLIQQAKQSVHFMTYHVQLQDVNNQSDAAKTLQSIILSSLEGLKVKLVLPHDSGQLNLKHTYASLQQSNVPFQTVQDLPYGLSILIVDQESVLVSSMPFADLVENPDKHHGSLVFSKDLAVSHINAFFENRTGTAESASILVENKIKIRASFLNKGVYKLYRKNYQTPFNLYLYLLYLAESKPLLLKSINENDLLRALFPSSSSKSQSKKDLKDMLLYLTDLKLIRFSDLLHNQFEIEVISSGDRYIVLPESFFTRQQYFIVDMKWFYVYCLAVEHAIFENTYPYLNEESFEATLPGRLKKHIQDLMVLLESEGFLEKQLPGETLLFTKPRLHFPMPLSYPRDTEEKLKAQYGEKLLYQAKVIAAQFRLDKNLNFVGQLLYYLTQLGLVEVQKVCFNLQQLPLLHPERSQSALFTALKEKLPSTVSGRINE